MTDIYLIRHAECEANRLDVISGALDDPLTSDGVLQAIRLRAFFVKQNIAFDQLYTSTAKRAIDTAKIIAPENIPSKHGELLEIDTGTMIQKVDHKNKVHFKIRDYISEPFPHGECYFDLYKRASTWFDHLKFEQSSAVGIVAHGGFIGMIIHHIIGDSHLIKFPLFELSNSSVTHLTMSLNRDNHFFKYINFVPLG